ncbi:MAG: hypothetical protein IT462_06330 [Planctomycetes bacterium]|nr:hypothetical protein [Planctomycetota bacterium]
MDARDKTELQKRLRRALKLIYLTSLGASHIYAGHARRACDLRAQLLVHSAEQRERREDAAALLAAMGRCKPLQRPVWHVISWLWGRLTSLTDRAFSLRMLATIEHESQKITRAADTMARELVDLPLVQGLAKMGKAEAARKDWLLEKLRDESRVTSPESNRQVPDTRRETRDS